MLINAFYVSLVDKMCTMLQKFILIYTLQKIFPRSLYFRSRMEGMGGIVHHRGQHRVRAVDARILPAAPNVVRVIFAIQDVRVLGEVAYNGIRYGRCPRIFEGNSVLDPVPLGPMAFATEIHS